MTVTYGAQLTVGQLPLLHARSHRLASKAAVVEGTSRLTWSELGERTARIANALAGLGVVKGAKVATVLTNRIQYPEIVYALAGLGAVVVPVSYRFPAAEMRAALDYADVEFAIVDGHLAGAFAEAHAALPRIEPGHVLVIDRPSSDGGYLDYETVLARSPASTGYLDMHEDDVYHLAFTGGTTGLPRACEIPQRVARQEWYDITVEIGIREDDVTLIAGPFYHGLGFSWGLQQLMTGGTLVLLREFDPRELLAVVQRERVTFIAMVPTMYEMVLQVPDKDRFDVSSVQRLMAAGSPLLTATKERTLAYFANAGLYELYGSTEADFYSILKPEDQLRKVRCAGLPYFGMELRIVDERGDDVAPGEIGLICKRGRGLGVRYYKDPEATEAQFRGDWITNGDLGRFDDEGYLYVVDRLKDMIISGGANIYPTEIENVIKGHPDVVEVAVIGHPDPKWGEVVVAHVVMRDGLPVPEAELEGLCLESLAAFKRPRAYVTHDELPKNASGKLLKRLLRDRVLAAEQTAG